MPYENIRHRFFSLADGQRKAIAECLLITFICFSWNESSCNSFFLAFYFCYLYINFIQFWLLVFFSTNKRQYLFFNRFFFCSHVVAVAALPFYPIQLQSCARRGRAVTTQRNVLKKLVCVCVVGLDLAASVIFAPHVLVYRTQCTLEQKQWNSG